MKSFTHLVCVKQIKTLSAFAVFMLLLSPSLKAQMRSYANVYEANIQGATAMFGNTLEAIDTTVGSTAVIDTFKMNNTRANGNSTYGNDNSNMQFVDIDGAAVSNSSSADLALPAGTNNIKFARLYWGGRVLSSTNMTDTANQKIKLRFGNQTTYYTFSAEQMNDTLTSSGISTKGSTEMYTYQGYADVTSTIQANGSGTYTVGNIPLTASSSLTGGAYGGWCIVVAYENTTAFSYYNSVRVYDGFEEVYDGGSSTLETVVLNNLNVPSGALSLRDAKMGVMAWEGDANLTGDSLRINNNYFSNAINPIGNVFNGSISDSGVFIHTKNPDLNNQMSLDIDQFYCGTGFGIQPDDQSVTLNFRTESDAYFPGVFTFVIKTKTPNPIITKTVADSNGSHIAEAGDLLTYTLTGQNTGIGNADLTVISDTLPSTVTYVPNSLKLIYSPGQTAGALTDASGDDDGEYISNGSTHTVQFQVGTGATATTGGTLADNDSFHYQFQVRVNTPTSGSVPPIVNIADVIAYSDAGVESIDFGTAIIDPQGGPLPVSLISFVVSLENKNETKIDWVTSMENNCKEYYVERSTDGINYSTVATVAGHGTTVSQNNYSVTDDITAINSSIIYYRLAQVDGDGEINYSRVIVVTLQNSQDGITVSPNPFTSYINVSLDWSRTEAVTANIYNTLGAKVSSKTMLLTQGLNYVSLDGLSGLPSGNYLVQFVSSNGSVVKKITK
jgi:uncharacterized repeat protein (TIGR01451 family)